jgi:hypothetical protein
VLLLQKLLWTRLRGRYDSRTNPALTAGLWKALEAELEFAGGHLSTAIVHERAPWDLYDRAKLCMDHASPTGSPVRRAGATLQLEDVHLLERFYNQLCLLVEAQKSSDPLSLVVVQMVLVIFDCALAVSNFWLNLRSQVAKFKGTVLPCSIAAFLSWQPHSL